MQVIGGSACMLQSELWRVALLAAFLTPATAAAAQDYTQGFVNPGEEAYASATPDDVADLPPKITDRVPIEVDDATLAKALSFDALLSSSKAKPLVRPDHATNAAKWNRVDNRDGSANFSVNKPLSVPWQAKVGADIATAAPAPETYGPRPLPGTAAANTGSASAWANVAVPHVATVEVRAEPSVDADKFATKVERSLPVGQSLSVTAQSSLGVTEFRAPTPDAATRLFSTDNSLQLNILATGTTLAAGTSTLTGDPVTHNRLSAGQKIYGPLNVTGTINDPGQPTSNMSLTAGMNLTW
jgi:hypothetical protein